LRACSCTSNVFPNTYHIVESAKLAVAADMNDDPFITPEVIEKWTLEGLLMPDYAVGDIDLSLRCPLDNSRHTLHPAQELGKLGRLPPEVLVNVVLSLDILSLTVFRRVNKGAMVFVDSVPQYQVVYRYSPNSPRSVLAIQARHFDFRPLLFLPVSRKQASAILSLLAEEASTAAAY